MAPALFSALAAVTGAVITPALLIIALTVSASNAAHAQSFPYNASYNGETSVLNSGEQGDANAATLDFWHKWRDRWIVQFGSNSKRVMFQEPGTSIQDETVSEGIGYGMLLCVYMNDTDDHGRFDDLFQYYKDHLNSNGLMNYKLNADGTPTADGVGDATDGDEDVAAALIFANKKWGDGGRWNYTYEVQKVLKQIKQWDVEDNYTVNGGSPFSQRRPFPSPTVIQFNASYFAPAWYRIYGDFTGDSGFWNNVIAKGYQILYASRYGGNDPNGTGLLPHFSDDNGGVYNGNTYAYGDYQYDAVRVPFRVNLDYAWYGNGDGQNIAAKIGKFYATKVNTAIPRQVYTTNIFARRSTDGYSYVDQYPSRLFDGNAGIAFLANGDRDNARYMYDSLRANGDYDSTLYFDGAWSLQCRLFLTGNFPNLYTSGQTNPSFAVTGYVYPGTTTVGTPVDINATIKNNGGSLNNSIQGLRVFDSANNVLLNYNVTGVNAPAGGTNYLYNHYTAPNTAGTYSIYAGVWDGNWGNYAWVSLGTLTVTDGSVLNNFETTGAQPAAVRRGMAAPAAPTGSTQGWKAVWGGISNVTTSSSQKKSGSYSLAFTVTGGNGNGYQAVGVSNPAVTKNSKVSAWVWVPASLKLNALNARVLNSASQIVGSVSKPGSSLTRGAWNQLTFTVNSNPGAINLLYVQFDTNGAGSGTAYIDYVTKQ